jgi:hypothetical protein
VLAAILFPQGMACSISNDARLSVPPPRSEGDA